MSQIRKHVLPAKHSALDIPMGSKLLAVGSYVPPGSMQPEHAIWTEEPTGAEARRAPQRWLVDTFMTGEYVDQHGASEHVGTHVGVDGAGRPYVTHFYLERMR